MNDALCNRDTWLGNARASARVRIVGLALVAAFASFPSAAADEPPITATRFSISIDGVQVARFSEAIMSTEVVLDDNRGTRVLGTLGEATFRRPQTADKWVWSIYEALLQRNVVQGQDMIVTVYDEAATPIKRYRMQNAWPKGVKVFTLVQGESTIDVEELTLAYEALHPVD